jgi:hypothetical protein
MIIMLASIKASAQTSNQSNVNTPLFTGNQSNVNTPLINNVATIRPLASVMQVLNIVLSPPPPVILYRLTDILAAGHVSALNVTLMQELLEDTSIQEPNMDEDATPTKEQIKKNNSKLNVGVRGN